MFEVSKGKKKRSIIALVYGEPGIGKTKLAASLGDAVVFDCESGSNFLDVNRIEIKDYSNLIEAFKWVAKEPWETVVLDSLTAIDSLAMRAVLNSHPRWSSIADGDYGAGYAEVKEKLTKVVNGCEYLRSLGKNVVIVAHSKVRTVNNPTTEAHERVEFEVNKDLLNSFNGVSDLTFYLKPKVVIGADRAVNTGKRIALLTDKGGHIAKNRLVQTQDVYEFENAKTQTEQLKIYEQFWKEMTNV